MCCFIVLLPPGAPVKACTTVLRGQVGQRAMSTSKWMVLDLLIWPTLKNFLFIRGTWRKWTAGRLASWCWAVWLQVWHSWLIFKTSLILRAAVTRGPCFLICCPKPDHISGWGQEPGCLTGTHYRLLTEKQIARHIARIWNRWSYSEKPYIAALYASNFYIPVCLFLYVRLKLKL